MSNSTTTSLQTHLQALASEPSPTDSVWVFEANIHKTLKAGSYWLGTDPDKCDLLLPAESGKELQVLALLRIEADTVHIYVSSTTVYLEAQTLDEENPIITMTSAEEAHINSSTTLCFYHGPASSPNAAVLATPFATWQLKRMPKIAPTSTDKKAIATPTDIIAPTTARLIDTKPILFAKPEKNKQWIVIRGIIALFLLGIAMLLVANWADKRTATAASSQNSGVSTTAGAMTNGSLENLTRTAPQNDSIITQSTNINDKNINKSLREFLTMQGAIAADLKIVTTANAIKPTISGFVDTQNQQLKFQQQLQKEGLNAEMRVNSVETLFLNLNADLGKNPFNAAQNMPHLKYLGSGNFELKVSENDYKKIKPKILSMIKNENLINSVHVDIYPEVSDPNFEMQATAVDYKINPLTGNVDVNGDQQLMALKDNPPLPFYVVEIKSGSFASAKLSTGSVVFKGATLPNGLTVASIDDNRVLMRHKNGRLEELKFSAVATKQVQNQSPSINANSTPNSTNALPSPSSNFLTNKP